MIGPGQEEEKTSTQKENKERRLNIGPLGLVYVACCVVICGLLCTDSTTYLPTYLSEACLEMVAILPGWLFDLHTHRGREKEASRADYVLFYCTVLR